MFGVGVIRHCKNCNKEVVFNNSLEYYVWDKNYYLGHKCYDCGANLSIEDEKAIKEAQKNNEYVAIRLV